MRRTEFIDVERRGFALDDLALVNDSLLAAMVADERVADAWEGNLFEGMFFEEANSAMARLWHEQRAASLAYLNRRMWRLNIERNVS